MPERRAEERISVVPSSSVDDFCRSYLDLKYHFDPAAGSAAGLIAQDSRLGSFDAEAVREHLAALRSLAGAVEESESEELAEEIDRTALLGEIRSTVYRLEHEQPHLRNPAFWLSHLFQSLYAIMRRSDEDIAGRVPAMLARLAAIPGFLESARSTLKEPPSVFVDTALSMLGGGGELIARGAGLFAQSAPEASVQINAAAGDALRALAEFGGALRDEIEVSSDPLSFAIGEDQFARRLHHEHAINAGASQLWRYGVQLQEEATKAIIQLAGELDARPWREVVDELRHDLPLDDDLFLAYRRELDSAHGFVVEHGLVSMPLGKVEVIPTPSFLTALVPFAAYEPPPIFLADRTGRFYVTRPDPSLSPEAFGQQQRGHCRHAIPVMVAHEAYPGHHLQLVSAQALGSEVRRHIWTPIMVEGWALYCEQLMEEAGFYRTKEVRLFQLVNLLWRAVRIVLDVSLHTRGMSPAQAVDYMVEHLPIERTSAEAEVRRYCAWPTYQLCYAVGRREILRLREGYRKRAGAGFSARQFHDELMRYGGLPVSLAAWGMGLSE
jgi:Bacterial protein of unknown function (DUF885)